ncbi:uncharacterized protein LOC130744739 [Lotus japonicus]|uniref:uncharacterized protein LOC130744739 n=1 Tax=Lotus japonicus TaxID=34305 RepID=UPI00259045FD|nr:uncharacterized protein LOC130744739 [Lotus japonicus]
MSSKPRLCKLEKVSELIWPKTRIWFVSHLNINIPNDIPGNFLNWLESILEHPEEDTMAEIFNLIWAIWCRRNAWTFDGQLWDIEKTLAKAACIGVSEPSHNISPPASSEPIKWKAPPSGFYKLNVDAAIKTNIGIGLGAIIRNNKGKTMAAATWMIEEIEDSALAEAAGVKWALKLAKDLGFDRVLLETDSLLFVKQWENNQSGISYLGDVVRECKYISSAFSLCTVSHVKRACNVVADFISNLAFTQQENCWIEEDPPGASILIFADVPIAVSTANERRDST